MYGSIYEKREAYKYVTISIIDNYQFIGIGFCVILYCEWRRILHGFMVLKIITNKIYELTFLF